MKKITDTLNRLKKEKKIGIMTHIIASCPSLVMSEKIANTMIKNGVDFIELQIPFSDPVADGPVMMKGNEIALKNKTKVNDVFELANKLTKTTNIPIIFVGYYNTMFQIGVDKFCARAKNAGISGILFPDIPIDEQINENYIKSCKKHNIAVIEFVSETSKNNNRNSWKHNSKNR